MSIKAINWALSLENMPMGPKFILTILANYSNENNECWPSFDEICKKSSSSRATVNKYLMYLESNNVIVRSKRKNDLGHNKSNMYTLNLSHSSTLELRDYAKKSAKVNIPTVQPLNSGQSSHLELWGTRILVHPTVQSEKSHSSFHSSHLELRPPYIQTITLEPPLPPKGSPIEPTKDQTDPKIEENDSKMDLLGDPISKKQIHTGDGFDKFWKAYPRKVGRGKSLEAWRIKKLAKWLPAILEDLDKRQELDDEWHSKNPFVPNPTTYLNQRRWEDEEKVRPKPKRDWETSEERNARVLKQTIENIKNTPQEDLDVWDD
jgi:hypothetical protein